MFGKEQPVSGFIDNAINLKHMQCYSMIVAGSYAIQLIS